MTNPSIFFFMIIVLGILVLGSLAPFYWFFKFINTLFEPAIFKFRKKSKKQVHPIINKTMPNDNIKISNTNENNDINTIDKVNTETTTQKLSNSYMIFLFVTIISVLLFTCINQFFVDAGVQQSIYSYESISPYKVISSQGSLTFIVILIGSLISYGILFNKGTSLAPIPYVFLNAMLFIGIFLSILVITQVLGSDSGADLILIIYFLAYQFIGLIFMYLEIMVKNMKALTHISFNGQIAYENKFLNSLYILFIKLQTNPLLILLLSVPILIVIQLILVLLGQRPDEFIKMFFDTSSYNYSTIPAPPPIILEGDSHYLCTVSARGHKKFVKPLRSGLRGGKRILVNRQLLVANAFENILEDYMPKTHKFIRYIYDKYGYPLSKNINTKLSADVVYILMKPLEWIFLFVLYCVDKKPENRINIQYSELRK